MLSLRDDRAVRFPEAVYICPHDPDRKRADETVFSLDADADDIGGDADHSLLALAAGLFCGSCVYRGQHEACCAEYGCGMLHGYISTKVRVRL